MIPGYRLSLVTFTIWRNLQHGTVGKEQHSRVKRILIIHIWVKILRRYKYTHTSIWCTNMKDPGAIYRATRNANICCMKKQEKLSHKQRLRLRDIDIFIEGPKKNMIQKTWTDWGDVTSLPIHLILSFVQTCKTFVWLPTLARSENNCEPNNNMCNPGGKSKGTRAVTMNSQSADSHTVSSVRPGQGWTVIRQMAITCSDMTEPYISSAP